MEENYKKYLELLAEKYPTIQAVCTEIINLNAILNLPKGTEHFMSDIHGEYEAFVHIMNNCSGEVRDKVEMIFRHTMTKQQRREICTLIYYPKEKLEEMKEQGEIDVNWYKETLKNLIEIAKVLSSKYTRSKVRKAMPEDFKYIIDELLHMQKDQDNNQIVYHENILNTIIEIYNSEEFIIALAELIKRLAVDHLHIVGDIFDRGSYPDRVMDRLMKHHSLDIQWGNHDVLWMGAAAGCDACIATVIRNNLKYDNMRMLENGYGISLRTLTLFAEKTYGNLEPMKAALKAMSVILFKLEGQIILRHPEYKMDDSLLLHRIDFDKGTIAIQGKVYPLNDTDFPTVDRENCYELTAGEKRLVKDLRKSFMESKTLREHIEFLYANGSIYQVFNNNLLYHGCIPLDENGNFDVIHLGGNTYSGKSYMDYADKMARRAFYSKKDMEALDFIWYLWRGVKSPLSGRKIKTFERMLIDDKSAWDEPRNPYYEFYNKEDTCNLILEEFGVKPSEGHIINGHTPVKVVKGEEPVRANGKLIIIDGGFCEAYHKTTGIAGYTLIYNSHSMRLMAHRPFENIKKAISDNLDIRSDRNKFETKEKRMLVKNTDIGRNILEQIFDLEELLKCYRLGEIKEK